MTNRHQPFPLWTENASKGDLLRVAEVLRSMVIDLAGVIVSMRASDEEGAQRRMSEYFESDRIFSNLTDEIGGNAADGE